MKHLKFGHNYDESFFVLSYLIPNFSTWGSSSLIPFFSKYIRLCWLFHLIHVMFKSLSLFLHSYWSISQLVCCSFLDQEFWKCESIRGNSSLTDYQTYVVQEYLVNFWVSGLWTLAFNIVSFLHHLRCFFRDVMIVLEQMSYATFASSEKKEPEVHPLLLSY